MAAAPMRKRQLKRENAGTVPTMRLVNIKLRPNSMELQREPSMACFDLANSFYPQGSSSSISFFAEKGFYLWYTRF